MEIKKDCYCYDLLKNDCKGLNDLYCKNQECKFYVTHEEYREKQRKVIERMKNLNR